MLTFEALRQRNNWHDVIAALRHAGVAQPQQRAEAIQRLANEWRLVVQQRSQAAQLRRLQDLDRPLVNALYSSRERAFEAAFESLLNRTEITFVKFDDGGRPGAFDYLLTIEERDELVVECKTRQGASLIDLNSARVVLASSEQFGYGNSPCVTICQPGVDPNVPPTLQSCARLALVETHDLAEAFVQLIEGTLTKQELHDWLAQPGQANTGTLYSTRSMRRQV